MRCLVDITAHGWGHLSQTAPVVAALRRLRPALDLVVRSGLPEDLLRRRLGPSCRIHPAATDFGLAMRGPFVVDRAATLDRYRALHAEFDREVETVADLLRTERIELVVSNVGYLALAGAKRAGVPSVAFSSLNWADMFEIYCGGQPGAAAVQEEMEAAYRGADLFVRLEPGMPMPRLRTQAVTRPIAALGRPRRAELAASLGAADKTIVLCAFGGIPPSEPPRFVREPGHLAVVGPADWSGSGVRGPDEAGMPFADLLASVDGVVTKPGYGTVAELGCLGTPSLMASRGDWPEEPFLLDWLSRHGRHALAPDLDRLSAADVERELRTLARHPSHAAEPGGEADVATAILTRLDARPRAGCA